MVERVDDADWDPLAGTPVAGSGRPHEFSYTPAGWLAAHVDHGDATPAQRTVTTFDAAGREVERVTAQGAGWSDTVQTTTWAWHAGGLLERLETRTGAGALVSFHEVGYVDAAGVFANGHRVAETFRRDSPEQATACRDTDCAAAYSFDARERLTAEHVTVTGTGATVTDMLFTLDVAGNVVAQTDDGDTTTFEYFGDQLQWVDPPAGPRQHHHHDPRGNLACVTLTGDAGDCDGIATGADLPQGVLAAHAWDPFDRLQAYRSFTQDPAGIADPQPDSHATYRHDPLDRVREQTESHDGDEQAAKTSVFAYLGLTAQVVTEQQTDHTGQPVTTKTYRHDAHGRVTGMVNTPDDPERGGPAGVFTYGFDVHGSVSTLLDEQGDVHAAYGYSPYGAGREQLSAGDTDPHDPLNPHRYTAKRLDTGTDSLDMGARRFGPDAGRFLSRDHYLGALADLGLTFDPLTGNRYALAAGNPISYVEHDGRTVIPNGTGGASPHVSPGEQHTKVTTTDSWDRSLDARRPASARALRMTLAGGFRLDHTRGRPDATRYWAHALGVDETTLAVTLEHESWHTRIGHGGLAELLGLRDSLGVGSVRLDTARQRLADTFGATYPEDSYELRYKMVTNIDFNVAVTAAHLAHLQRQHGLTGREAFTAYAYEDRTVATLSAEHFDVMRLPDDIRLSDEGRRVMGPLRLRRWVVCTFESCLDGRHLSDAARHLVGRQQRWDELSPTFAP